MKRPAVIIIGLLFTMTLLAGTVLAAPNPTVHINYDKNGFIVHF